MAQTSRIASSDGAFLEVSLQSVASGEGIVAKSTRTVAHQYLDTKSVALLQLRNDAYALMCGASDDWRGDKLCYSLSMDTSRAGLSHVSCSWPVHWLR